ncbi:MAG: hypothetical protein FJ098_17325, partial [Deltaproteobacteria bacterium]|nr:hypothetical protein [Deltaproteobacteria bacterium]
PPVLCDPPCPAGFSCVDGSCCSFKDATCDGVDDDCDGETDDDYVVIPSCGKGVCKDGSVPSSCVDGVETPCEPGPPDEDEDQTCDGLDGDCDGFKDEDYPVEADCGEGWCQDTAAPSSCAGGVESPCVPGAPAEGTDLSCDGVDGDCDGETDEDYEVVSACGKGWCLLAANPSSCEGGLETPCMPGTKAEATDVTCDGVDGDCDGATDEDYAPKLSCGKGWCQWSNQPSTCIGGVETPCLPGTPLGATDASCDGVDGDCDGVADDDYVSDETCGLGACRWTNTPSTCSGGVELPCKPGVPATSDGDCDLVDDDCNGEADEDADPPCDAGDPVLGLEVEILTEVGLPAGLAEELGDGSYLGRIVDLTDAGAGGDVHADAHGNPSAAVPLQVAPGPVNQVLLALHADEVHADGATVHALISATDAMGAGVDEDTEVRILALFDGESWWTDAQPAGDGIFSAGIEVPPQAFDGGGELLVQAVSGIHSSTVMTCQVVSSPAAPAPPAG